MYEDHPGTPTRHVSRVERLGRDHGRERRAGTEPLRVGHRRPDVGQPRRINQLEPADQPLDDVSTGLHVPVEEDAAPFVDPPEHRLAQLLAWTRRGTSKGEVPVKAPELRVRGLQPLDEGRYERRVVGILDGALYVLNALGDLFALASSVGEWIIGGCEVEEAVDEVLVQRDAGGYAAGSGSGRDALLTLRWSEGATLVSCATRSSWASATCPYMTVRLKRRSFRQPSRCCAMRCLRSCLSSTVRIR
jgi:hypothetical protein